MARFVRDPLGPPKAPGVLKPHPIRAWLRRRYQRDFQRWFSYARARMAAEAELPGPGPVPPLPGGASGAEDLALVREVLSGSASARLRLVQRLVCVPRMLGALNARLGRPFGVHDLEDLSQDVVVALWRALPSFAGLSTLESWAFRSCHRALLARLHRSPAHWALRDSATLERYPSPAAQRNDEVYLALDQIETRARRVIELKHFDGLTFEEIGGQLSTSPNTVKAWYYRALEDLKRLLAREQREGEA